MRADDVDEVWLDAVEIAEGDEFGEGLFAYVEDA